jgi:4-amino-4-deoxy-L-arabinose transferase-like glycosyltransferase
MTAGTRVSGSRQAGRLREASRASRAPLVAVAGVTAVALALRVVGIDQSLFMDERYSHAIVTGNGLGGVWHDVFHTSITPPLHYFIAWLSVQIAGDSTILVRIPSLIFGTALVPLVFLLGKRVGGNRAGLLAAVLMALSPFAIFYSDEARAYATMMFLVALSTLALLRALENGGRRWWVAYALSSCAALWSHYTAVFVLGAGALWALWAHRERRRGVLVAVTAIAGGYLPWLPGFLEQNRNQGVDILSSFSSVSFGSVFELPLRTLVGHPFLTLDEVPGEKGLLMLLFLAALTLAVAIRRPPTPRRLLPSLSSERGLLLILAVATPVGMLLYDVVGPSLFGLRNLSASQPAFVVIVAVALASLTRATAARVAAPAVAGLILVLALVAIESVGADDQRPPYREVAHYLDDVAGADDPLVESLQILGPDARLRQSALDLYFERAHSLYRFGQNDTPAWRRLRDGHDVYLVLPRQPAVVEALGLDRAPPALLSRQERLGGPDGRAVVRQQRKFAGFIPISVLRYSGSVHGRLGGRKGVLSWSLGKRVTIVPGAARGRVEHVTPGKERLTLNGWALDATRPRLADWVLYFSGGRLLAVSPAGGLRPDIARAFGPSASLAGFSLSPAQAPAEHAAIRVFAVVGKRASELPFTGAARRSLARAAS